ncbi:hypothetical protein AAC387_Pa07g0382 [Persea americana]
MKKAGEASTSERQKDVEMGGSGSHGNGDCTCSEFLDEASTSERQKDVEMGGSGSHGNGDCTCTESLDEASSSERQKDVEMGGSGSHGNGDCTCTETQWVEYIKKKLNENKVSRQAGQAGIAKVPEFCRDIDEAYKPCIISIGPYHRGNSETEPMEQRKWQCLNEILHRKSESHLNECFKVLKDLEVEARSSYLDDFQLKSMCFMEMMLLDGCFMVDYLRQPSKYIPGTRPWMRTQIDNDLLLVENQLPFFVLENIFPLVKEENEREGLAELTLKFCRHVRPSDSKLSPSWLATRKLQHLLHSYHAYLFYDSGQKSSGAIAPDQIRTIHSASFLEESGIEFKRVKPTTKVLDVSYSNGVIKITPLKIDAFTGSQFRNLIAFEKFNPSIEPRFTAFTEFMDYIINESTDVTLLRKHRIIDHALGSDGEVATLFNQLNTRTFDDLPPDMADIYTGAQAFYRKKRNKWKAILKQKYMDSPWAIISVVFGGVLILLLTIIQVVYAILTYHKPPS